LSAFWTKFRGYFGVTIFAVHVNGRIFLGFLEISTNVEVLANGWKLYLSAKYNTKGK
jgi:hypothetical protein